MFPISSWYDRLGYHSFPTVFVGLRADQKTALLEAAGRDVVDSPTSSVEKSVAAALQKAIRALPGSCFVGADVCAPTDSPLFAESASVSNGDRAWQMLTSSPKVRQALQQDQTSRLTVRPFRNMNRIREFRLFLYDRELVAMSQMNLERHFKRFARRHDQLWGQGCELATAFRDGLPADHAVVDIYFCSNGDALLVDMNQWGEPTDPLLLRTWDQDWTARPGLKLIAPPLDLSGDVSVSF